MTKKSRYFLLAVGFIVFLILAPLIVLYVRGITYDFATKNFVSTGIFGIQAQPKDAEVYLNGKEKRTSAGDIKFVVPGEYQLTLKKSGYNDWTKRLSVAAGQVTWANPADSPIYLLLSSPAAKILSEKVLDFYGITGNSAYLTDTEIIAGNKHYTLPKSVNAILSQDKGSKNFVLGAPASSGPPTLLYFSAAAGNFRDLSGLFSAPPQLQFSDSGDLYALSAGSLYKINIADKTKIAIFHNVLAFYWQGNNLYYIQRNQGVNSLLVTQDPFSQSQLLLNSAPEFSQGSLIITFGKQIFLEADGSLYQDDGDFELVAGNVANFNFDANSSILSFFHSGEFDYIDSNQNLNFITRSGRALNNLTVNPYIGYAFYSTNQQITAIELDARGNQNQYVLYSGTNIEKFSVDSSGQNILVLDNGILKTLKIR